MPLVCDCRLNLGEVAWFPRSLQGAAAQYFVQGDLIGQPGEAEIDENLLRAVIRALRVV